MHEVHKNTQIFCNSNRGSDSVLAKWAVGRQIDTPTVWQTGGWPAKLQASGGFQRARKLTVSHRVSQCLRVYVSACLGAELWQSTGPNGGFLATRVAQSEFADVMMKSACFEENELFLHFTSFKC